MASIREQIITALITVIDGAVALPVVRSPLEPLGRETEAVCVVEWVRENMEPLTYDRSQSQLGVRVSIFTRSPTAEQDADEQMVTLHRALMLDRTLGGLAMNVALSGAAKQRDDLDQILCTIGHEYRIEYRMKQGDIAAP